MLVAELLTQVWTREVMSKEDQAKMPLVVMLPWAVAERSEVVFSQPGVAQGLPEAARSQVAWQGTLVRKMRKASTVMLTLPQPMA